MGSRTAVRGIGAEKKERFPPKLRAAHPPALQPSTCEELFCSVAGGEDERRSARRCLVSFPQLFRSSSKPRDNASAFLRPRSSTPQLWLLQGRRKRFLRRRGQAPHVRALSAHDRQRLEKVSEAQVESEAHRHLVYPKAHGGQSPFVETLSKAESSVA
eukprot:scaffold429_cov269-Pinguiococcus_pyrenoidosus.AAC.24